IHLWYFTIKPLLPTAQPFFLSTNNAKRFCLVPLSCSIQVCPRLLERRITPDRPAIQPSSSLTNCTLNKVARAGDSTFVQLLPPSSVLRIVPRSPTAQPSFSFRKST